MLETTTPSSSLLASSIRTVFGLPVNHRKVDLLLYQELTRRQSFTNLDVHCADLHTLAIDGDLEGILGWSAFVGRETVFNKVKKSAGPSHSIDLRHRPVTMFFPVKRRQALLRSNLPRNSRNNEAHASPRCPYRTLRFFSSIDV